jgi:flagellar biosynthesis/type III secretory pathway protein FliH
LNTDAISCIVEFPPYQDGDYYCYKVPVKRFWEFTADDFQGRMFALIPFQVFTFRKVIAAIVKDKDIPNHEKKLHVHAELARLKECIEQSYEYILAAHRQHQITDEDVNKMSTVIFNLSRHLYNKFETYYDSFFTEVEQMVKSIFDMKLLKQAREEAMKEGKQEGLKEGMKEGMKEGKIKGKIEGMIEAKRELLLFQFSQKNLLDDRIKKHILSTTDDAQIQKLSSLILTATSKQDILQQLDLENH